MIHLSSSPHFSEGLSTQKIMLAVIIALLPECINGVLLFGAPALAAILTSVAGCVIFEALFQKISGQKISVKNLSAVVSGIMLALVISPSVPLWMILTGDLVAVVIAKGLFGGIGSNVFNPALTGRAFMFLSFPAAMGSKWIFPSSGIDAVSHATNLDAVSQATVLSQIKSGSFEASKEAYLQLFYGNRAGCIGETSVLLILISFVFLLVIRVIDWRAPVAMVASVALCTFAAGKDVLLALLTGGLMFGAVFMVTDYATAPLTKGGRLIFGAGCGLITFLIRNFGGYPEGVMFSILIMNTLTPFLNNITTRMYGYGKKGNRRPAAKKIIQDFDVANAREVKNEQ